jgi:outer membrane protein TolC
VDRPVIEKVEVDVDAAIETALASRPEMYSAQTTVKSRELSERVAKRQILHQLDLVGNYRPQGSSPDINDVFVPGLAAPDSSIGTAWERVGDEYNWTAQLVYRVPISNRNAKAGYARAKISRTQAETDLSNQEQTIRVEVRRAARAVDSGVKRIEAAQTNVRLQREKLEAEQKKFDNGMSTSFEVLTFQNDLSNAQLTHIRAQLDYVKAIAELERAKGTLLEARGLELEK